VTSWLVLEVELAATSSPVSEVELAVASSLVLEVEADSFVDVERELVSFLYFDRMLEDDVIGSSTDVLVSCFASRVVPLVSTSCAVDVALALVLVAGPTLLVDSDNVSVTS
jgi:hypothetical protein